MRCNVWAGLCLRHFAFLCSLRLLQQTTLLICQVTLGIQSENWAAIDLERMIVDDSKYLLWILVALVGIMLVMNFL